MPQVQGMFRLLFIALSKFPKTLANELDLHIQPLVSIVGFIQLVLFARTWGAHIHDNNKLTASIELKRFKMFQDD